LRWFEPVPELAPGEHWQLQVRLKQPHGFANRVVLITNDGCFSRVFALLAMFEQIVRIVVPV
jgi:hypothetical protein